MLVSGGLDSTLMAILAKNEGIRQYPLFVNYGQLCLNQEWRACRGVHRRHALPPPVMMNLSGYGEAIPCGLTYRRVRINEDAFLPGRNLLFLLAGAGYASKVGAKGVSIGLLSEEYRLFPDQSSTFLRKAEEVLELAVGRPVRVMAPLMSLSKRSVVTLARAKGIVGTYSCHSGRSKPCGLCISCQELANAAAQGR